MHINLYLREMGEDSGHLIGTADPLDDFEALAKRVKEYGVGGEVFEVAGQFVADERGAGFEIVYADSPELAP